MSYSYQVERKGIFTEAGAKRLLVVRDKVLSALHTTGAFRLQELGLCSWEDFAVVDYLVELGQLVEMKRECWGQYRVFTTPEVTNR
jgi:hypothetical protein